MHDYFAAEQYLDSGIPTVTAIAALLHLSADYLSQVLKLTTGQNTRQHIQNKVIEHSKQRLSITSLSVAEIAYELGFEHPQSFSTLFKKHTRQTPLEFRATFKY